MSLISTPQHTKATGNRHNLKNKSELKVWKVLKKAAPWIMSAAATR